MIAYYRKGKIKSCIKTMERKLVIFLKSTITSSSTSESGATSSPTSGSAFMYIGTKSDNHGNERVFVSWERTHIFQITNITFDYNRFSILTNDSIKSMGRSRIRLLSEDNTCSTLYNIPKNDRYSKSSTQWTLVGVNCTVENYAYK